RRYTPHGQNIGSDGYYYTKLPSNHAQFNSNRCLTSDSQYQAITDPDNIEAPGVGTGSAAALTNYANWYSYYRRRAYLMKFATGEAFKDLDPDTYRVGLFFLNSAESGA